MRTTRPFLLLILLLWGGSVGGRIPLLKKEELGRCVPEMLQLRRQRYLLLLCQQHPELAVTAYHGLRVAVHECQRQMLFNRWDCTQDHPTHRRAFTILHDPPILKYGYRESAFLVALSSAGVAWGVARACSAGHLHTCLCNSDGHSAKQNWEWGGCSFSVKYGLISSRKLLRPKGQRKRRGLQGHMYRHNLKAGRLAVKRTLGEVCKCHGVSGSCQMKTCWKAAGEMEQIGAHLKKRYLGAKLMLGRQSPNESNPRFDKHEARNSDLVYFEESPNYCRPRYQIRTTGVAGRVCSIRNDSNQVGDCDGLCCDRGFQTIREKLTQNCNCTFHWCCRVTCETCLTTRLLSKCT